MNRSRALYSKQAILTWVTVCLLVVLQAQLLPAFSVSQPASTALNPDKSAVRTQYASLPLAFEPNQGQVDGGAQFLVHHGQATTYFDGASTTTTVGSDHVTMSLDGANTPSFSGTDPLESKTNYFIGNDKSKWHSDISNYKQLLAKNVYPGIDLKYYGTNSQLEHDFIVNPGSDPKQIAFHFDGQQNLSLDKDGNLILKAGESDLRLNAPTAYQQTRTSKQTIPSHFELNGNAITVAFTAEYDHSQPLIIDPVLIYSTYLGGSGDDQGVGIVVDANGNAYITGCTTSANFPTSSPVQASNAGGSPFGDVSITKFNPAGSALLYSTYLGGSGDDPVDGIALDTAGNVYVTGGTTSTNFPTASPFQAASGGGTDGFLTKLNASGSALIYSTYLGGSALDQMLTVAVDSAGAAYVAGRTASTNFPVASPFQGSNAGAEDTFVTKFNAAGSALTYSTYLGGSGTDQGQAITVDTSGNAYVTGNTDSTNFPTSSPFQAAKAAGVDVFVTKLNAAGSALTYSTYLGGSGDEIGKSITLDTSNNAYLTGRTASTNFPTSSPFQGSNGGGANDAFATKLNAAGSALTYSTYLGGSGDDQGKSIVVNASGNVYLLGTTASTNFPTSSPYQGSNGGGIDIFVTKLNPAGSSLTYSTYLGGSGTDTEPLIAENAIALGLNGNAYLTGITTSTNFPTASPFQGSNAGGSGDIFVTQLSENTVVVTGQIAPTLTFTIGSTTCSMGTFSVAQTQECVHTISASTNAQSGYVISYISTTTLTSGAYTIDAMASQTSSTTGIEQFGMNLKANTAAGSNTAANFGADPSGGIGTAMSGYQTTNLFKFATGGANIAQATGASATTNYTVSFISNIAVSTEAGTYSTPVTYNIIATY